MAAALDARRLSGPPLVLMGGVSSEREVSLRSGRAVVEALRARGIAVEPFVVDREDLEGLPPSPAAAVIALHGRFGEDGTVQRLLEERGIPYTGSGPAASRLAMDKLASRSRFRAAGLAVPDTVPLAPGATPAAALAALGLPLVVKPRSEGSSLGVSVVRRAGDLRAALEAAWGFGGHALAERFVAGTEVTVAVLEGRALPLVLIRPPGDGFFSYRAKYEAGAGTVEVADPPLPDALRRAAADAGVRAAESLGCRHYARTDVILAPDGTPVVLEVNTIPGMTPTSLYPQAAAAAGIAFGDLWVRLLALAIGDGRRSACSTRRRDDALRRARGTAATRRLPAGATA
ncbi:MAG: D-alanine--D-alanine ligase [Planctomycetales bacterium]|nr:D-alanine--D-alanine ligase [Planctomycetales bacterium]